MTGMILRIDACLKVEVDMKVYYDCPHMSGESFKADAFFRKYKGAYGTIVGFSTEYVGPLDSKGRLPGTYYRPGGIDVQFDGEDEVHTGLNIDHFVLMSPTSTVDLDIPLTHQLAGDLPNPIRFYPGDVVCKTDDLLRAQRIVERVSVNDDGKLVYTLAETVDDRTAREKEDEERNQKAREDGHMFAGLMPSFARTEHCSGEQLELITAGNIHWLYVDSSKMQFGSPEDEVHFWARDGLSKTVYGESGMVPVWEFPFEKARQMLEAGNGDIIVRSHEFENVKIVGKSGDHQVRRLHACFGEHRDRVRTLALGLETPPGEAERSMEDLTRAMMEE